MKSNRTIKSILSFVLIAMVTFTTTSCSEDDAETVDVRDQAIGSYEGTLEILSLADLNVEYVEDAISFIVEKNDDNASTINISIDGDIIKGVKVAEASNGFTFDIETQSLNLDDDIEDETIEGEDFFELGGTKYHGLYDSSKKEFSFAMSTTFNFDTDDDGITDMEVEALLGISGSKK